MNKEQFLSALTETTKYIQWYKIGFAIRGRTPSGLVCPITGVYFHKNQEWYPSMYYKHIGLQLGMDSKLTHAVASAADDYTSTLVTREELCKAVNL